MICGKVMKNLINYFTKTIVPGLFSQMHFTIAHEVLSDDSHNFDQKLLHQILFLLHTSIDKARQYFSKMFFFRRECAFSIWESGKEFTWTFFSFSCLLCGLGHGIINIINGNF